MRIVERGSTPPIAAIDFGPPMDQEPNNVEMSLRCRDVKGGPPIAVFVCAIAQKAMSSSEVLVSLPAFDRKDAQTSEHTCKAILTSPES